MYTCNFTGKFKMDYKRAVKRNWNLELFEKTYDLLECQGELYLLFRK